MNVELVQVGEEWIATLSNLGELYEYDFSEFAGDDVGEDGRFARLDWPRMFAKPAHHAYVVRVDGRLAGFASVHEGEAFRDTAERVWWIDEFFVMRKYRRRGVGKRVAFELFDRLGGVWEVGQIPSNLAALQFWRRVIGSYTDGRYEEFQMNDDRWQGTVQYFRTTR